jgi:hypothetical protein
LVVRSTDGSSFEPLSSISTEAASYRMRVPCEAPWSWYSQLVGVVDFTQLFRLSLVRVQEPPRRFSRSSNWLRSIDLPSASLSQPWLASWTPRTSRS